MNEPLMFTFVIVVLVAKYRVARHILWLLHRSQLPHFTFLCEGEAIVLMVLRIVFVRALG